MSVKILLAAALVAAPVPASAPIITYDEQRAAIDYPLVKKVRCTEGSGTAFRVGPTRLLSVAHVTRGTNCLIDNAPITVIEQDNAHDFAIIEAGPPKLGALKINCGGFHTSEWYWSDGYAWGLPYQTAVAVFTSAFHDETGKRILYGKHAFIPGMSGGPVMNAEGEVVGLVNAYHPIFGLSFSRDLKDTSLCQH